MYFYMVNACFKNDIRNMPAFGSTIALKMTFPINLTLTALLEIFVPKNHFSSNFSYSSSSPSHKLTNIFKSHKNNLPMFRFLLNLENL